MNNGALNVSQAFEICHEVFARAPRQTHGHAVNDRNQLVPIPGAITGYDSGGRPVIARPLPETPEPKRKPLRAVSIDSLVEADGNVDTAETHEVSPDDPVELLPPAPAPVAGQDDSSPELTWEDAVLDEASAETSDARLDECE